MRTITYKRGDTAPPLRAALRNADGTRPDLNGADVVLILARYGHPDDETDAVALTFDADVLTDQDEDVERDWEEGDLAVPWTYFLEWQVTYADGKVESFPGEGYQRFVLKNDLNPDEEEFS